MSNGSTYPIDTVGDVFGYVRPGQVTTPYVCEVGQYIPYTSPYPPGNDNRAINPGNRSLQRTTKERAPEKSLLAVPKNITPGEVKCTLLY